MQRRHGTVAGGCHEDEGRRSSNAEEDRQEERRTVGGGRRLQDLGRTLASSTVCPGSCSVCLSAPARRVLSADHGHGAARRSTSRSRRSSGRLPPSLFFLIFHGGFLIWSGLYPLVLYALYNCSGSVQSVHLLQGNCGGQCLWFPWLQPSMKIEVPRRFPMKGIG